MAQRAAQTALIALILLLVAGPITLTLTDALRVPGTHSLALSPADIARLWRTAFYAALIAALATLLALPLAWWTRRWRTGWTALLLTPLLMPSYLAYSGLGLVRDPTTALGSFLARGPASGANWYPILADRVLAVVGLALWAWPIAWLVLAGAVRRIDDDLLDTLRLDAPSPRARARMMIRVVLGPIALAWLLVAVVMLGSAVPLHLAQIDTYATSIWLALARESGLGPWLRAWPLGLTAVVTAVVLVKLLNRQSADVTTGVASKPTSTAARTGVWMLVAISTLVPITSFAFFLRDPGAIARFWHLNADAIADSSAVALIVAIASIAIGLTTSLACARGRTPLVAIALLIALIGALTPGVLIGSATAHAWGRFPMTDPIRDSLAVVVLGHLARFAFATMLVGAALARADGRALTDLRELDGAACLRGWLQADLPRHGPTVVASGLAVAALSLHEIEATVMIQPPGTDSLARRLLELLHYLRYDDLAAGVLIVGLGSLVLVGLAGALIVRWRGTTGC